MHAEHSQYQKKHTMDDVVESKIILTQGKWGDTPWEFVIDSSMPEPSLCTATFCIVTYQKRVVLVEHSKRGFEFAGGHIDPHESCHITVKREVLEESGAVINNLNHFGYKKVSPPEPVSHRDNPHLVYPYPHSYVPYFYAEADELLLNHPLTDDVKGIYLATFAEAKVLLAANHNHEVILNHLVESGVIEID